jgi:hypothetical protein
MPSTTIVMMSSGDLVSMEASTPAELVAFGVPDLDDFERGWLASLMRRQVS